MSIYVIKNFLFSQYRKLVTKESDILPPFFEPCSSCVEVDFFLRKEDDFWKTKTPIKGKF